MSDLTPEAIASFTEAILARFPEWTVRVICDDQVTAYARAGAGGIVLQAGRYYLIGRVDGRIGTVKAEGSLGELLAGIA